jgi:hypothetical protein
VRRVVLPLLVLAAFLPSSVLARSQFLCEIDLVTRDACCCPPSASKQLAGSPLAPATPEMQRTCCKIVKQIAAGSPAATEHAPTPVAPIAIALVVTPVIAPVHDARCAIVPRAQAPPPRSSLLSQHSALLL